MPKSVLQFLRDLLPLQEILFPNHILRVLKNFFWNLLVGGTTGIFIFKKSYIFSIILKPLFLSAHTSKYARGKGPPRKNSIVSSSVQINLKYGREAGDCWRDDDVVKKKKFCAFIAFKSIPLYPCKFFESSFLPSNKF